MLSHGSTGIGQNEVVAVANVLDREKHAVQPGLYDGEEDRLERGEGRAGR